MENPRTRFHHGTTRARLDCYILELSDFMRNANPTAHIPRFALASECIYSIQPPPIQWLAFVICHLRRSLLVISCLFTIPIFPLLAFSGHA